MEGYSREETAPEVYHQIGGLEPVAAEKQVYPGFNGYGVEQQDYKTPDQRWRNPFGLRPFAFGALAALITAIIVGAAVGGGLGGTLANCRSQRST